MSGVTSLHQLFFTEPPGRFAFGHVFRSAEVFWTDSEIAARGDTGYWSCDLADRNRLTWSETIYELFGLPAGEPIPRDLAVARYSEQSKIVLDRVRTFSIKNRCGFMLDAAIRPDGLDNRWIRIATIPIVEDGKVVGLHGIKRALQSPIPRQQSKPRRARMAGSD
jgi:hypothetical protein